MNWLTNFAQEKIIINAQNVGIPVINANNSVLDNIFSTVYVAIGAFAVFFIIRGALLFVTHGNNPAEVKKARDTVLNAVAALAGSTLVFALIQLVIRSL